MINKSLLIYGFYGSGKSVFCANHKDYLDADFHYYNFSMDAFTCPYEQYLKKESEAYKGILINVYQKNIDIAFFPETYELAVTRCIERKQGNFIPYEEEYKDMIHLLQKDKTEIIFLKEDEYIDTYKDYILNYERTKTMKTVQEKAQALTEMEEKIKKQEEKLNQLKASYEKKKEKSKDEIKKYCVDICLDALVVGAYGMHMAHGETAPYYHSYYVTPGYRYSDKNPIPHTFCYSVTSKSWDKLPESLYNFLTEKQNWKLSDFEELKKESDKLWELEPEGYHADFYEQNKKQYLHGNHIANGYETDGFDSIALNKCGGTYSSCTTSSQNELARVIVALRGFCPEVVIPNNPYQSKVIKELCEKIYANHGIDSDLSDLNAWAKRNPTRCCSDKPYFVDIEDIDKDKEDDYER